MTLLPILAFTAAALAIGRLVPHRWRTWAIMGASLLGLFWLQPALPLRNFDFWLPAAAILLVVFTWALTKPGVLREPGGKKAFLLVLAAAGFIILAVSLLRYLGPACCITATRPPAMERAALFLAIGGGLALLPLALPKKNWLPAVGIILILGIFVILKTSTFAGTTSTWLRILTGQDVSLATASDIAWLGFSFLAFRLLHVLLDSRAGRLPAYRLDEFVAYALFFPALAAGPIDRIQRYSGDLAQPKALPEPGTLTGFKRIALGIFKKFVIADTLALIALSGQNAAQVQSTAWLWVILYAYSLRIYFDFSGYTDIAIGIGNLMGFNLPENFNRPYLQFNLTAFWNSWHMSLAQWFRAYLFNPLTRALRVRLPSASAWLVILAGQLTTMLLIGLWHGITWNFAIWGLWHGVGLFIHNRWSAWSRPRLTNIAPHTSQAYLLQVGGWLLTINFVTLGWVWFALPDPELSIKVFQSLVGR